MDLVQAWNIINENIFIWLLIIYTQKGIQLRFIRPNESLLMTSVTLMLVKRVH